MNIKELGELLINVHRISFNEVRVGDTIYNDEGRGCVRYGEIETINKRGDLISKDGIYVAVRDYNPEAKLYLLKRGKTPMPTEIGSYIRITDTRPQKPFDEGVVLRLNKTPEGSVCWQVSKNSLRYYEQFFIDQDIEWEQVWLTGNGS